MSGRHHKKAAFGPSGGGRVYARDSNPPMSTDPADSDPKHADTEYEEGDLECTHCGGEGLCWDGSDPLGNCPDDPHRCHACNGSGKRRDQVIF